MEFILYCDESLKEGKFFSNFYGGALVASEHLDEINTRLYGLKNKLNIKGEMKWSKVTENYLEKYKEFVGMYFSFLKEEKLKTRIMFTHRMVEAVGLTQSHREEEYFILYYQFVKHAFGLKYCGGANLRIYFDRLPDTKEKVELFKNRIVSLPKSLDFRKANITLLKENIAEVDYDRHPILEGLDIVLGSMAFRLNDKHREIPKGFTRRGKRTVAKEKLYKFIQSKICELSANNRFNIGANTAMKSPQDTWNNSYRHWKFTPKNAVVDHSKAKSQKKNKKK